MVDYSGLISSGMWSIASPLALGLLAASMGSTAVALFNGIVAFARLATAGKLAPSEWPWSAQDFSSYWMMRISFCVANITALAVHHGVRRALEAHAEL